MKIRYLLKKCFLDHQYLNNHPISKLSFNSKTCCDNCVFFAIDGYKTDGHRFIKEAILNGAKTIIYEKEVVKENYYINYIKVNNVKHILALMAKYFYHDISRKITLIGITGTKGKSTTATILFDYLNWLGKKAMLMGTEGILYNADWQITNNTTPDILTLYEMMQKYYRKGMRYLVMEVSSIAYDEYRVSYLDFDLMIMTNLGHDHLDYHGDFSSYRNSKLMILKMLEYSKNKRVIINADDASFSFYQAKIPAKLITYGIKNQADIFASDIISKKQKNSFKINSRRMYSINTNLLGIFNIYNLLACFAVISYLKLPISEYVKMLASYPSIKGRLNLINFQDKKVLIDFAHTPESVEMVLKTVKENYNQSIILVIGCGGDRDIEKRKLMGLISVKLADEVIFTTDNPRTENPKDIIDMMIKDIKEDNYRVIINRMEAINYALAKETPDEIVVILGKGAEEYQEIKGIKYPFSDYKCVYDYFYYCGKERKVIS